MANAAGVQVDVFNWMASKVEKALFDDLAQSLKEAKEIALHRRQEMKDRCHDEAMAELFKEDPAHAVDLVNSILDGGDQDDLQIAFRQMDKAGLFDRAGVRYEVACDVLGAIIAHYSEALALEYEKPIPDDAVVARIEADKRALRALRSSIDPKDAAAIETVIQQYGPQARALYSANQRPA